MGNENSTANQSEVNNQAVNRETTALTSSAAPINVEEFFGFLQSLPNDEKLKRILELSQSLIEQKPELVKKVREAEASLRLHHRNVAISKIVGSSVGIASGISFIAGIALASPREYPSVLRSAVGSLEAPEEPLLLELTSLEIV